MITDKTVFDLIELAYAAAENPSQWKIFLGSLQNAVRGTTTAFVFDDIQGHANVAASVNFDPECARMYTEYYSSRNAWAIAAGPDKLKTGAVVTSQFVLPDSQLVKTEYYNGFLKPMDTHHLLGAIAFREKTSFSQVSILRPKRRGPFVDAEVRMMQTLMPHMQRALRLHQKIVTLGGERGFMSEALDHFPVGVVILDAKFQPILVNRSAREIMDAKDGLSLASDGLFAACPSEAAELSRLVRGACQTGTGKGLGSGGVLAISRHSLLRPYSVFVTPLHSETRAFGEVPGAAAVFITDPEQKAQPDERVLMRLHGLTRAEARLVTRLLGGESVEEAAAALEVSVNTARTHMKHLFDKTQTNRHRELLRILLASVASVRLG